LSSIGRQAARHAAAALGASVVAPHLYWRAQPREHPQLFRHWNFGAR
jgi:hypothetical protein